MGRDRIRSRFEVWTKDGRHLHEWVDENYRGGPHNPMSDAGLERKFRDCAEGLLDRARIGRIFEFVWALEDQDAVTDVYDLLDWHGNAGRRQMIA
jgi:2-methylcitrate dehydratase PrpD